MAITSMTETERKYEVDESTRIPDLTSLGDVLFEDPVTLRAVYYDTSDGALAARLFTLRRRTGGKDEGWHLKTPIPEGRTEHHSPLETVEGDTQVHVPPRGLVDLVKAVVRDKELVEIARVTTVRTIVHVLGTDGSAVAEIADDQVSATDVHSGILRLWREWEAELLDSAPRDPRGRRAVLDAIEKILLEAGASPAKSASKLAQATGRTSLAPPRASRAGKAELSRSSTTLDVVTAILADLTSALIAADPRARADDPDAVHTLRTIVRRLRAVLASFRGVLDPDVIDEVRGQLRQFGAVLGTVRDAEVRRLRALTLLEGGADGVEGIRPDANLERRLVDDALGEYGALFTEMLVYLNSAEYFALLDDLDGLVARPPLTDLSTLPAGKELRYVLREQSKRARKRLERAESGEIAALHEARKAARQLRYVAEALSSGVAPIFGGKVRAIGDAAHEVQKVIGDHRDSLLFVERLDETAREATEAGENAQDYGALAHAERANARAALDGLRGAVKKLKAAAKR